MFAIQGSSSVRARSRSLAPPGAGSSETTEQGSSSEIFLGSGSTSTSGSAQGSSSTSGSASGSSETFSRDSLAFCSFSALRRSSWAALILSRFALRKKYLC